MVVGIFLVIIVFILINFIFEYYWCGVVCWLVFVWMIFGIFIGSVFGVLIVV